MSPRQTTAKLRPDEAIACAASPEMKVGPDVAGSSGLGRAGLFVEALALRSRGSVSTRRS
jgi:hypothetical protein